MARRIKRNPWEPKTKVSICNYCGKIVPNINHCTELQSRKCHNVERQNNADLMTTGDLGITPDHVPASIAQEAANRIAELRKNQRTVKNEPEKCQHIQGFPCDFCGQVMSDYALRAKDQS